jgi:hypothetical protein
MGRLRKYQSALVILDVETDFRLNAVLEFAADQGGEKCTTDSGSFHPICKAFYQLCLVIEAEADWRVQVDGRTSILCVCN